MNCPCFRPLALLAATTLTLACGDDGGPVSTAGGSDSATDSTDTDSASSTSSGGATVGTGGGSGSGGASTGGSTGGGVTEINIFGEVKDYVADAAIPDVTITSYEDVSLTTVAGADGAYQLGPFTPNSEGNLVLPPITDHWGAVIPVGFGDVDPQEVELAMISRMFVQTQIEILQDQTPAVHDETTAFMVVRVIQNTAINEGVVTITVDPPPPADTYYAPNDTGVPMLGSSDAQFSLLPVVIFYNLAPMDPGGYTVTASHAVRTCSISYPSFPTLGSHITLVDVDCPPV